MLQSSNIHVDYRPTGIVAPWHTNNIVAKWQHHLLHMVVASLLLHMCNNHVGLLQFTVLQNENTYVGYLLFSLLGIEHINCDDNWRRFYVNSKTYSSIKYNILTYLQIMWRQSDVLRGNCRLRRPVRYHSPEVTVVSQHSTKTTASNVFADLP